MHKVTLLNENHGLLLNDDDNKPWRMKVSKENQDKRFFISWNQRIYNQRDNIDLAIDWIVEHTKIRLQARSLPTYRKLCEVILLNLGKSLLQRRWLQIPRGSSAYEKGTQPYQLNFSKRHVDEIIRVLVSSDSIFEVKGAKYLKDPQFSAYQPTEQFNIQIALETLSSVDLGPNELVRITSKGRELTDEEMLTVKQDEADLRKINDYLLDKSFPLKGPMIRIYSKKVGSCGRIYCDVQALAKRRVPLRQFSLIEGERIAEVDIVSSHPRMMIQEYFNQKISRTFYQDIADELDITRDKVKHYFVVAIGSGSRDKARNGFVGKAYGYDKHDFNTLHNWVTLNYPDAPLYRHWSFVAMNNEGEILKEVMLRGVDANKPVLPIHDAVAVKVSDIDWATKTLKDVWRDFFGRDYCEVDVEVADIEDLLPSSLFPPPHI